MEFDGHEQHSISLEEATKLTENYRAAHGTSFKAAYFSQEGIKLLLDQDGCVGIRIYNAQSETGDRQFVLVGVRDDGEDLYDGEITEQGYQCPPYCAPSSPLNATT